MSRKLHTLLLFFVVLIFLMVIAGCGSGNQITTPAAEGFTNSNLNGTYSFSATGQNAGGFFTMAGSMTANGSGTITGGSLDLSSPGEAVVLNNTPLTGTYNVLSDGRTQVSISAAGNTFNLQMVLLSNSNGLVITFDTGDTASGSLDLQNSSAFSLASLAGSFAFNLSGTDGVTAEPEATAGTFTFNTSGGITTGVQDFIDNAVVTANVGITGGTVAAPTNGRGTISLVTNVGTLSFAFYAIDPNHIRLVSLDSSPLPTLSGDAFRQPASFTTSSTLPAGTFAFTLAGTDLSSAAAGDPYVSGGILTADGNGNITSGTQDVNVAGTLTQNAAVSGTYTVAATGRGTLSLTSSLGPQSFAIYPTMTGGVLALDLGGVINDGGSILQQSGAPFSNGTINGTYGMNFSGLNLNEGAEVNAVAQFTANGSGSLSGAFDFNNVGTLSPSQTLTGSYSISANGRGTGTLNIPNASALGLSNLGIIHYAVSSSRILFIEADPVQPAVGVFAQQTTQ
jgi:hypothetical protein